MTSWVSDAANDTEIQLRMHDRTINEGYSLIEVSFSMSAARCALSDEVRIYIYQNDGSGSYGTLRYSVSFDPGPGSVPIATSEMTRILVVSSGSTEPIYARAVVSGVSASDDFVLTTPNCITSIVTSDAYDPNEGDIYASSITSGTTHSGLLINNDTDYYLVSITSPNQNLLVSMSYLNDYRTTESNLDLDLYLVNGSGTLASSTSSAVSTTSSITETIDEVLDPGTYYIVVSPKSAEPNRNFYTLNWDTQLPPSYQISGNVSDGDDNAIRYVNLTGLPGSPVTDESGDYSVEVDYGWSGTVTPVLAGYTFDPVSISYTDVQESHVNDDYTATLDQFTISGRITNGSGTGEPGVTLIGFPEAVVTDADGYYFGTVPYDWSVTIIPQSASLVFSPVSYVYTQVRADIPDQDFTSSPRTYNLYGNVMTTTGTPLEGVSMNGFPETVVTNAAGVYTGAVEQGWSGTITPDLEGYTFDPVSVNMTNVSTTQQIPDFRGTLNTYEISGTVTISGGAALPGVTLSGLPGDPVSDVNGDYSVTVDHGWSGTVTPSLTAYTFDPVSITYSSVSSTQVQDYTGTLNTYSIYGVVTVSGGNELEGVTLNGLPENPVTDFTGNYSATVDYGWSGTVTPALTGYTFDPVSIDYSSVAADQLQDYTATPNTHVIDGYVRTGGGAGIGGVLMSGLPGDPLTDATGYYSGNVLYGTSYTVTPTLTGYSFTPASTTYSPVTGDATTDYTGEEDLYLNVNQHIILMTAESGANSTVVVTSNVAWTVNSPAGWITCDPESGSDDGSVIVTASEANTGSASRETTVTVSGGGISHDIPVSQAGSDPFLEVSSTSAGLGAAAASTQTVDLISNIAWTVSETADWLSVAPASGSGNGSLTLTADLANASADPRSTTVVVSGSGITRNIEVTQTGAGASLEVSSATVSLGAAASSSQSVDITSNIAWTVSESADWLTVAPASGSGDATITLTTDVENETTDPKNTTVTVAGGGISHNISVTQEGADPSLEISTPTETLTDTAGSWITVHILSNIPWEASVNATWLSIAPASSWGDRGMKVTADSANTEATARTAALSVEGGGMIRNITITQDGSNNTGIGDPRAQLDIEIYPNPATNHVYLKSNSELRDEIRLNVLSMDGRLLSQEELPHLIPGEELMVDLSAYPAGQYLLQLENDYIQQVFKVVKK